MTKEVCQAARERPVRVYWEWGGGKDQVRMSERGFWGRGVAKVGGMAGCAHKGLFGLGWEC